MLVLEELEFAKARGAKILGEIIGYGMSSDAYHMTGIAPEGAGAQRSMRRGVAATRVLLVTDVGYVNAHAPSTPAGDGNESKAIELVFGEHAISKVLKVSNTKSMTGHLLGAAGGLEAGVTAMTLLDQKDSTDDQSDDAGRGLHSGLCPQQGHRRKGETWHCRIPSASAASTLR